jgi:hypothetical protein
LRSGLAATGLVPLEVKMPDRGTVVIWHNTADPIPSERDLQWMVVKSRRQAWKEACLDAYEKRRLAAREREVDARLAEVNAQLLKFGVELPTKPENQK